MLVSLTLAYQVLRQRPRRKHQAILVQSAQEQPIDLPRHRRRVVVLHQSCQRHLLRRHARAQHMNYLSIFLNPVSVPRLAFTQG